MTITLHRECSAVAMTKPARHRGNINTFFNTSRREIMPEIMMGETWKSQLATCSAKTPFCTFYSDNQIRSLRLGFSFPSFQKCLQFSRHRNESVTGFRFYSVNPDFPTFEIGILPPGSMGFSQTRPGIREEFDQISTSFSFFLAVASAVGFAHLGDDFLELLSGRGEDFAIRDFLPLYTRRWIGKNEAVIHCVFENRFHRVQFVSESLRCNVAAPVSSPLFAVTNFNITNARILEKFRQVLDAGISTRQRATGDRVLRRFIPVLSDLPKIQIGIITDSKRADFGFEITEPTFR